MYNLGTVFRFEVLRTLKKRTFWIMAAAFPIIIGVIFCIIYFSNVATSKASEDTKKQKFSLEVQDDSGLLNDGVIKALDAHRTTDKSAAIDRVKNGTLDAYFYYPKDLTKDKVQIYAKDAGLFDNGRYSGVAQAILEQSVAPTVNPQETAVLQGKVGTESVTYKDGVEFDGFKALIAPGIFLLLFYLLITMFGNQMLASTTEEKENRVIEMILTTIKARTLIVGKILSLLVLALIQMVVIMAPVVIAYVLLRDSLALPNFDLSNIPIDPVRVVIGAGLFLFSFLMFTGLLVAIGAAVPTAKEAASFFGLVMVLMFGPLYAVTLFVSTPNAPIVQVLSYFPLTAPIPLMLRNAVGNLPVLSGVLGIVILAVSAVITLAIAVRMFQFGALEYSRRLSIRDIFHKKA